VVNVSSYALPPIMISAARSFSIYCLRYSTGAANVGSYTADYSPGDRFRRYARVILVDFTLPRMLALSVELIARKMVPSTVGVLKLMLSPFVARFVAGMPKITR
jgi:hypothetical protein